MGSLCGKKGAYVVEGGEVFCTKGDATTTMVASVNSRIGCKHVIVDVDTTDESFDGDFGICATLTALNGGEPVECAKSLLPKWFNTNEKYLSEGHPHVGMKSFAVCTAGLGLIIPLEDGQTKADFDLEAFLEMVKGYIGW